jgi:predicted ATPase
LPARYGDEVLNDVIFPNSLEGDFPFNLAILRRPLSLENVTVIVGENGCGKSALLEGIAYAAELPLVGTEESVDRDGSLAVARELGDALKLGWSARSRRGFFLRAEDYLGYVKRQNAMKAEMRRDLERIRRENPDLQAEELARISSPYQSSISVTEERYGKDLGARSHGEGFLDLFAARLRGPGLYVLDEPEIALSPLRQLAFLSLIRASVEAGGQFLIATHSPIVMAYPGALLLEAGDDGLQPTSFDDLEHVQMLRQFLGSPEAFTRYI